jgi:hypothetical protein
MRYGQGGTMPDKPIKLEIHINKPDPTDEELRAAIIAAVNNTHFVTALRNAHATSKVVEVTSHREFNK